MERMSLWMQPANICVKAHQLYPYCLSKTVSVFSPSSKALWASLPASPEMKKQQTFLPLFKAAFGEATLLFFNSGPSEGGAQGWGPHFWALLQTQVFRDFPLRSSRLVTNSSIHPGRRMPTSYKLPANFSFLLLLSWRKAGRLLRVVFRNLYWWHLLKLPLLGFFPAAFLLQGKVGWPIHFSEDSVIPGCSPILHIPLHARPLPLSFSCQCHQNTRVQQSCFFLGFGIRNSMLRK